MSPLDPPARPRHRDGGRPDPPPDTRRVFVAVFPPPEVLDALAGLRERLEPELPGLRWVGTGNLHFTLRFLGDRTGEEIERAVAVLDRVAPSAASFDLELSGLGVFPGWSRPRVLWLGCAAGGAVLEALARTLERGFRDARLGRADKRFVPHLTLGRWRDPRGLDRERAERTCARVARVAGFRVETVGLIRSRLDPGGSVYTPLHRARLTREPGSAGAGSGAGRPG